MINANQSGVLVAPTNNALIDGVLWGYKWPTTALTYAFPTSASSFGYALQNFTPFNAAQVDASIAILKQFSDVSGLTFTAAADASLGNIRAAGVSGIDYQNRTPPVFTQPAGNQNSAEANPPDPEAIKAAYGDALFNLTDFLAPVKGNYAFFTIIHEFGHSLGLKHGHAAQGVTGTNITLPTLPTDRDSNEFSVMTYRSFIGGPTQGPNGTPETNGYAQSLMMADIAALQTMYGANYGTNSGNTTYTFSAKTGEMFVNGVGQGAPGGNRVFLTIWDGGGTDTYDFSNYTQDQAIDLGPGSWSLFSNEQRANLGTITANGDPNFARANVFNSLLFQGDTRSLIENAIGGSGNDTITGNQARNVLKGNAGNDKIDGGAGLDTAVFQGTRASYTLSDLNTTTKVATVTDGTISRDGTDTLAGIERIRFSDQIIALDTDGNAGQGYRIYQAAFARTPDLPGLSYWVNQLDTKISLRDLAFGFIASNEFKTVYGAAPTNLQLVTKFYQNVLGRDGEKAGIDYWVGLLDKGTSVIDVLAGFSEGKENIDKVAPLIGQGITLEASAFT